MRPQPDNRRVFTAVGLFSSGPDRITCGQFAQIEGGNESPSAPSTLPDDLNVLLEISGCYCISEGSIYESGGDSLASLDSEEIHRAWWPPTNKSDPPVNEAIAPRNGLITINS